MKEEKKDSEILAEFLAESFEKYYEDYRQSRYPTEDEKIENIGYNILFVMGFVAIFTFFWLHLLYITEHL